jgi:hypothetical protein
VRVLARSPELARPRLPAVSLQLQFS